jgi:hypothetical protein
MGGPRRDGERLRMGTIMGTGAVGGGGWRTVVKIGTVVGKGTSTDMATV